ncbi:hypothetical protein Trydic_g15263 [Trypoxylus dichotomus]
MRRNKTNDCKCNFQKRNWDKRNDQFDCEDDRSYLSAHRYTPTLYYDKAQCIAGLGVYRPRIFSIRILF